MLRLDRLLRVGNVGGMLVNPALDEYNMGESIVGSPWEIGVNGRTKEMCITACENDVDAICIT